MAKSSLSKKFDQIKKREEEKTFSTKKRSRIVSKFLNNRLAVVGLIIFTIIILPGGLPPQKNCYGVFPENTVQIEYTITFLCFF